MSDILIATETFVTEIDGQEVTVHKGRTRVRAGHPLAVASPDHFKELDVHFDVEDASSKPRSGRRKASE